jgi:hypothetical protein
MPKEKRRFRERPSEVNIIYYDQFTTEVNVMEVVRRHILKRVDGVPVNVRFEPVHSISRALRVDKELFDTLMNGHFKPDRPEDYYMQEIEISYKEVTEDVQQVGDDQQDSSGDGEV